MAKSKKKTRWELLAEAGKELNKVLGLVDDQGGPGIKTDKASEDELEEKLLEAMELITEDDEFSEQTAGVLETLIAEDDEVEDMGMAMLMREVDRNEYSSRDEVMSILDADEEEFDDSPEASIDNLIMEVKTTKKRKELRKLIQSVDTLEPLRERLPELKTSQVLKEATLKFLKGLNADGEEVEDEETPEAEQVKKEAPKKAKEAKDLKPAEEAKPEKKAPKKKAGKKKNTGKSNTPSYTVTDAVIDAIENVCENPATTKEISEKAAELYSKKTGDEITDRYARLIIGGVLPALLHFEILKKEKQAYQFINNV